MVNIAWMISEGVGAVIGSYVSDRWVQLVRKTNQMCPIYGKFITCVWGLITRLISIKIVNAIGLRSCFF